MAFRTGKTTYVPGKRGGTTTRGKSGQAKTHSGPGKAPAGTKKVAAPTIDTVPVTTVTSSGKVTTSGYPSQKAASRAERRAKAARARQRRIVREIKAKAQTRSESKPPKPKRYTPPKPVKATKVSTKLPGAPKLPPSPTSKPKNFTGKPTAGSPTRSELTKAKAAGTLKVNRKGYVTTPKVRRAAKKLKKAKKAVAKQRSRADLPHLSGEEERNAKTVLRIAEKRGASRKEKLAAIETGLVESGFHNYTDQAMTDADSLGWRQERTSIYGTGPKGPTNVKASAHRFIDELRSDAGTSTAPTPGALAQAAQGSAFPERYDERAGEAKQILSAYNKGKGSPKLTKKLKAAEGEAKKLGLDVAKPTGRVTKKQMTRFKAAFAAAKHIDKQKLPYVWGGGHNAGEVELGSGVDCSGAVSYVLQKMGVKLPGGVVSGEMGSYLKPGPGAVTVFYNPTHTFMKIGNKYFGTSGANPGGGAGFIPKDVGDSEASSGTYQVGHVSGLGQKVAVALGVPASGGSFPGMTLSESGTTATINEGAGTTKDQPGFSSKPIKLTPTQKAQRKLRKLSELGAGVGETEETETSKPTTLKSLAEKYGVSVG